MPRPTSTTPRVVVPSVVCADVSISDVRAALTVEKV